MRNTDCSSEALVLLFVDDDALVLNAYRRMLRLSSFKCLFFTDVEFRLDDAFVSTVDIAFFDQNMPHIRGAELLSHFKQVNPCARRVLMSGDFSRNEINQKSDEIYHALLPKPCSKETLLQCVAALSHCSS